MDNSLAVRPELIAEKLRAIRNLEEPRLSNEVREQPRIPEMLFFLQWRSMQPGGLPKFRLRDPGGK